MKSFLLVGLGGFLGANLRFLVADWALRRWGDAFPYGTLIVNLVGSFLIGFAVMFLADQFEQDPHLKLLLVTGFLGAFTTFSSYMLEIVQLVTGHTAQHGWLYLAVSILLGVGAVLFGTYLGDRAAHMAPVSS